MNKFMIGLGARLRLVIIYAGIMTGMLVSGCGGVESSQPPATTEGNSRYAPWFSAFKELDADTLEVYYSVEAENGEFDGAALDSAAVVLFPEDIAAQHFADTPGLFSLYRFPINTHTTAFMARTPSVYSPTSIKLFFYDRRSDSITSYLEIAEIFGDAGDYMAKVSLLLRDKARSTQLLTWVMQSHDSSMDDGPDRVDEEKRYYTLMDLSKGYADTISTDSAHITRLYGNVISRYGKHIE